MFSRLRHPIRSITEPYGKAGLTVAILALVMAMVGGAYAAGKLTSGQKKEVEKIAKKFAGKPGANGTNGANGAPGAEGKQGAEGKEGKEGKAGTNGTAGANGKTVLHGTGAPAATLGEEGDFYVETNEDELYGPKGAGSGAGVWGTPVSLKGEQGEKGEPWSPNNTLPPGATETGFWFAEFNSVETTAPEEAKNTETLSIPISLAGKIEGVTLLNPAGHIETVVQDESTEHCPGTTEHPKAASGYFCFYSPQPNVVVFPHGPLGQQIDPTGAWLHFFIIRPPGNGEGGEDLGSWAVTG